MIATLCRTASESSSRILNEGDRPEVREEAGVCEHAEDGELPGRAKGVDRVISRERRVSAIADDCEMVVLLVTLDVLGT
jgi:hypothetical protein